MLAGIVIGSVMAVTAAGIVTATGSEQEASCEGRQTILVSGGSAPVHWMFGMRADSESGYLTEMLRHHEEAVAAARQLRRSERPEMRELGARIVMARSAEITKMKAWLADWYPGHAAPAGRRIPVRDMSALSGDALDKAFLQDMVPHQMATLMLAKQLPADGPRQHKEVAALARTVRDEQRAELARMRQHLTDWFGADADLACGP